MASKDYYIDESKIIVKSLKELKEYVQTQIEYLKYECPELKKTLKKRYSISNMYIDNSKTNRKTIGRVISFGKKGKLSDQDIEDFLDTSYISFWCERIPKKNLDQYSGFEEVNLE